MDDHPYVQHTVRYNAVYLQPLIGDIICKVAFLIDIDGVVQDIRLDHMSLLVYNTLTTLVLFDTLDKERFEVGT